MNDPASPFYWTEAGFLASRATDIGAVDGEGNPISWEEPDGPFTLPPKPLPTFTVRVGIVAVSAAARDEQEALTILTAGHDLGPQDALIQWIAGQANAVTVIVTPNTP